MDNTHMVRPLHIIMPVKDSISLTERAIRAITESGYTLTVYNDFSTAENTATLTRLAYELGFGLVNLSDLTNHPSPNYHLVLQIAQEKAIDEEADLLIVESDVIVKKETIYKMIEVKSQRSKNFEPSPLNLEPIGMVAAVTVDEQGNINFPYQYAKHYKQGVVDTKKRLSFCCTLLTNELLHAYSFHDLDPTKNWYDVFISHKSRELGFHNLLLTDTPVLHLPHSSRPWKHLKYTNPLLYYWRKITQKKDRI